MDDLVNKLLEQIQNGEYRDLYFTTYNFLDENNWLLEQKSINGFDYDIDDLSFIKLNLGDNIENEVKFSDVLLNRQLSRLKDIVVSSTENRMGLFVMKDIGVLMAVKPKNYDISNVKFCV